MTWQIASKAPEERIPALVGSRQRFLPASQSTRGDRTSLEQRQRHMAETFDPAQSSRAIGQQGKDPTGRCPPEMLERSSSGAVTSLLNGRSREARLRNASGRSAVLDPVLVEECEDRLGMHAYPGVQKLVLNLPGRRSRRPRRESESVLPGV